MPKNPTDSTAPLDVRSIHHLVRLMKRYDLTAIDLIEGSTKIRLRRRGTETFVVPSAPARASAIAASTCASSSGAGRTRSAGPINARDVGSSATHCPRA